MFKRISLGLLVVLLTTSPLAAAAPADRTADDGGSFGEVVQAWTGWLRLVGIDLGGDREEREEPRSFSDEEEGGPHTDPSG